ncbi:MAG: zinc-ribbon domain-containing protein [Oscillospiraceae bacterium]|nr:zinc-ribbon domain-containing protein [Oscillospiraceae bacterium]
MSYCSKCGSKIESNAQFCTQCGAPVEGGAAKTMPEFDLNQLGKDSVDSTAAFSAQDISENKVICILCYFGLLLLIPLLVKKDSAFARFHSNQGLILFIFDILVSILAAVPVVGWIISIVGSIAGVVFWIMGIVNVLNGRAKTLPLIGGITLIK